MKNYDESLRQLEQEHLAVQPNAWPHLCVHGKMLLLAFKFRDWKEVSGQILRLILAGPGSLLGKAPPGNLGNTKMGIFESQKVKHE